MSALLLTMDQLTLEEPRPCKLSGFVEITPRTSGKAVVSGPCLCDETASRGKEDIHRGSSQLLESLPSLAIHPLAHR